MYIIFFYAELLKMADAQIHAVVNSLFECGVCFQVFQNPRILPCGHTFCLQCIKRINNQFCSTCNREWSLPTIGLQGLPINFIAENFVSSVGSVSKCAVTQNNDHGPVESFCIDCWDPLCGKCGQGHTQFNRLTMNHVIKKIIDIDDKDIEKHNQEKKSLCTEHKNDKIKLYCSNCDTFICNTCYVLSHNKHECTSIEETDAKQTEELNELIKAVDENRQRNEKVVNNLLLQAKTLSADENSLIKTLNMLIRDVKQKLKDEYDKVIDTIDTCLNKAVQLIKEKVNREKVKLEKFVDETKIKLLSLQELLSSLQKHLSPMTSVTERNDFLKDYTVKQQVKNVLSHTNQSANYSINQLTGVYKWKSQINNWLQSYKQALLSIINNIPLLNGEDIMIERKR